MRNLSERLFHLQERRTSVRTEILGGATTFLTMAYIIVLNPATLSNAGIPTGPSTVATILAAVFGCLLMGLYANRPIAVAPYMGENAFIAFGLAGLLIDGVAVTWQQRLGAVFVSGVAFLLLTLLRVRAWLAGSISVSMKHSFAVGIGLFLLLLGLYQTGIVTSSVTGMPLAKLPLADPQTVGVPAVPMKIGNLHDPQVLLAVAGFVLMMTFLYWNVRGGILLGIISTAAAGWLLLEVGKVPEQVPGGAVGRCLRPGPDCRPARHRRRAAAEFSADPAADAFPDELP